MAEHRPADPRVFEVWFVPTDKGREAFKWTERLVSKHPTYMEALDAAYFEEVDEPAPDKRDYGRYEVRSL